MLKKCRFSFMLWNMKFFSYFDIDDSRRKKLSPRFYQNLKSAFFIAFTIANYRLLSPGGNWPLTIFTESNCAKTNGVGPTRLVDHDN